MDRKKLTTFLAMPMLLLGGLGAAPQSVGDQTETRIFDHAPDPRALAEILFPPRYRGTRPAAPGEDAFGMMINFEFDSADIKAESESMLDSVGKMMDLNRVGRRAIVIEGHTDASMRGRVDAELVKLLSMNRAGAVKEALAAKYDLDPNQFNVKGMGWDRPADSGDPRNHAKNRRVEIKVYPAEATL